MAKHLPSVCEALGSNLSAGSSREEVTCQSSTKAHSVQTRFFSISLQTISPLFNLFHVTFGQRIPMIKHGLGLER